MKKATLFSKGFFALCLIAINSVFAQRGKDGVGNISASTVVNVYTNLTAGGYPNSMALNVGNATGFSAGDLILVIQMYGAEVNAYMDPNNFNNSLPQDTSYGKVKKYNGAGLNEFVQVNSVNTGSGLINLDCGLKNDYDSTRAVQVIRVPRYDSLTINVGGTITCPAWNGVTGGVVALEVRGNTRINSNTGINVSSLGYRGAVPKQSTGYTATNTGAWWPELGAIKGEGIVGDTTWYHNAFSGSLCKGNVANAGGGGNAMNCGGGGGSNGGVIANWNGMGNPDMSTANNITAWGLEPLVSNTGTTRPTSSSGGGRGGYAYSENSSSGSASPTVTGPNNFAVWGSDARHNDGGWGGIPLDYSTGRMFMGGGGGAGDSNDGNGSGGGNGGGIVYLMSYGTVTGTGRILANGATALNTNWNTTPGKCGDDGAGGGGGGGAVFINSVGAITLTNATPISAVGGNGGSYQYHCFSTAKNYGPGGGGGGGHVATSNAVISTVAGGTNGICILGGGNNSQIAQKFPPNGSTAGGAGGTATLTNFYLTTTNYTICAGTSASLSVTIGGTPPGGITVNWYNTNVGGSVIGSGNPYSTGPLTVGTYTYYAGTCPGTYRAPVVVTVLTAPTVTATATPTVICSGQSAVLSGSGATSYTWSANAGSATTATVSVSPTSNTTYTVTGANGTCTNTQTVSVNVNSAPTLTTTASPTVICSGQSAVLTASGATSYTWSANAGSVTTATASVSPTGNTTYTVTGANGTCTSTQTVSVNVNSAPTLTTTASPTVICSGQSAVLTASGATSYTWSANAGSVTTATASVSPTGNTTYTVTGANGTCTSTQTVSVNVNAAPTLTTTASPTVICSGQSAVLTASGATSYTWSANAGSVTTATASVSPTGNTTYTVTGANGTCTSTQTVSVNVNTAPTPSITANPASICSGQSTVLTASGATSYTWSANAGSATTATVSVSPGSTTVYTVTGDNSGCVNTQTISITVGSSPSLTITATNTVICSGQSVVLTANGATTYTWSANAGSVTTSTASVSPGTNETYTVTGDNAGCVGTQTIAVSVGTTPTVSAVASPTVICSGQSIVLTAAGATTYTWSTNAGSATTSTVSVSPTSSDTYTVTGDNGGCTATQTVSVVVNTAPTLTITATPAAICNGSSTTLTGAGASSYTWSANAGSATTSTVSVSPTVSESYTLTGDNGSGCLSTQVISITVNNGPTDLDSAFAAAACGQANGSYTINAVNGGSPNYQVNFNNTGFTAIGSFPYTVGSLSAGIYPVVIQDNNGCTYTTSVNINNLGGITQVDSATGSASCNPNNNGFIVLNSVTGGTGPYSVSVNGGGFTSIVSFPDSIKNLTAGTYTVVVQDNAGCLHTSLITVGSIGAITQVNSTSQNAVCNPPNSGVIVLTSVTGGTGPYSVDVNGGGFNTIASFPDSLKNLTAGSYTVTIQDASGCTNTSVINVGSQAGPTAATSSTANDTCNNNVGTLTVGTVTGGTPNYQYSLNGGPLQSPTSFTGLASGVYTVTVQDNNGCTYNFTDSVGLTIAPSPTITAQGPTTFCQGGSVVLSSSSASGNTWSTSATTQTISVNSSGTYSVSVTQNGCTVGSNAISVTVDPTPTITVNSPAICSGGSTTLSVSGASTYTWSPATGLSGTSGSTVTANPGTTTTYTIDATDANGCTTSNTAMVTVNPTPAAPLVAPDSLYYCLYQTAPTLSATATGGATLNWYNSSMSPLSTAPTPSTNILGTTTYYVSQSLGACEGVATPIVVMVIPGPSAVFTTSPLTGDIIPGQNVVFIPNQQYPFYIYAWNFDDPGSGSNNNSSQAVPGHVYNTAGLYCPQLIIISTQTGCVDSNTVCLDVLNGVVVTIPNIFSPNDDNINDVFSIKTEGIRELSCDIYDRWGLKLYGWNGTTGYWDGTTNGKQCSVGTYFYIVTVTDVKGVTETYRGHLQLLK